MGSEPTELIAAELRSDWAPAAAQGRGRPSLIDGPGRGAGRGGDWGVCASAGAAGLWPHQRSLALPRLLLARPRPRAGGLEPAGPGRAVPGEGSTLWGRWRLPPTPIVPLRCKLPAVAGPAGEGAAPLSGFVFK